MSARASSPMTRWGLPLFLIAIGGGLSIFVSTRAAVPLSSEALASLPAVALVVLLVVRAAAGPGGRLGDLVVTLLVAFVIGIHVLFLAVKLGMTSRLDLGVPMATAVLFVALAPVIGTLEAGSAMGLRTRATLADAAIWGRAHRRLGLAFALAGVLGGLTVALEETVMAVAVMGGIPVLAMVVLAAVAGREHRGAELRPTDERN